MLLFVYGCLFVCWLLDNQMIFKQLIGNKH